MAAPRRRLTLSQIYDHLLSILPYPNNRNIYWHQTEPNHILVTNTVTIQKKPYGNFLSYKVWTVIVAFFFEITYIHPHAVYFT